MGVQRLANETSLLNTRKKRQYNERILNVERGSFKPFVLSANGGKECKKNYGRLPNSNATKRKERYSKVLSWVRRKINFTWMNSLNLCLRGSRSIYETYCESLWKILRKPVKPSQTLTNVRKVFIGFCSIFYIN